MGMQILTVKGQQTKLEYARILYQEDQSINGMVAQDYLNLNP
jgi:hypothetical protein